MKNTLRCCISCIFPCGSLDVIRIIHSNGRVEEISGKIRAEDVMKAYPKHVLKQPSSPSYTDDGGVNCPEIVILPPDAELRRGKIYFLMPLPSSSTSEKTSRRKKKKKENIGIPNSNFVSVGNIDKGKKKENIGIFNRNCISVGNIDNGNNNTDFLKSDCYLSEILSEKVSTQRERRRGRVGVWRPRLESIFEATSDA